MIPLSDTVINKFNSEKNFKTIGYFYDSKNNELKSVLYELDTKKSDKILKGNVLKADAYIFFSTIILLLLHDSVAYRSYESAKKVLLSCLNK